jgi:hypothetical protein
MPEVIVVKLHNFLTLVILRRGDFVATESVSK